jgi:tRNA dimethylallyltransferase
MSNKQLVVFIVGPTAVGKTAFAIQLAQKLNTEIISADSRLLYRGMDIGTAKPSPKEVQTVKHHLIDVADPPETWSLGKYKDAIFEVINSLHAKKKLPIVVGGTGQYIRALTQGWTVPEITADEHLRDILETWSKEIGTEALHTRLAVLDPLAAASIDHRNVRRTIRALEVVFKTGQPFSAQRQQEEIPYLPLVMGLQCPRAELYQRVDDRIAAMLAAGFEQEVRFLLKKYPSDLPAFSAIGYKQMISYIQGEIALDEAIMDWKRATRVFVRHQANWFKPDDSAIHWIEAGSNSLRAALKIIESAGD